jgi:two-component system LytT family response regulator
MKNTFTSLENLVYLKANSNYTEFHYLDGKKHISSYTLKKHQNSQMAKRFLRISNSILLNPSYIESIEKFQITTVVRMINGTEHIASRRRKTVLDIL